MDPLDPTPYYEQIANAIEADIKAKRLKAGDLIPSETTIRQTYGVARGTARKAVETLRDRGLVVTIPQRGTYVC